MRTIAFPFFALLLCTGCVGKIGMITPTRGRAKPAFSAGLEVYVPLQEPEKRFAMAAFSYEEHSSLLVHNAGLSRGTIRTRSAGAQLRMLFQLPGRHSVARITKSTPEKEGESDQEIIEEVSLPG